MMALHPTKDVMKSGTVFRPGILSFDIHLPFCNINRCGFMGTNSNFHEESMAFLCSDFSAFNVVIL